MILGDIKHLVSTTQHLLGLNPDDDSAYRIHSGQGLYFGLARDMENGIYVACRNATDDPENEAVRAAERGSILVFNSGLTISDELTAPFPLRDLHQILCFDGKLWITCSFDNMVAVYDLGSKGWWQWYPAPDPMDRGRDVHHFNTIAVVDNELCVVAHRFGASELFFFSYPALQLTRILPMGRMAHNVFPFRGALATCSSEEGCIVNTRGESLEVSGFPRGVAMTERGTLVGISALAARGSRANQDAVVRSYTPNWQFKADYILPGVGMILDILPISAETPLARMERWPHAEKIDYRYHTECEDMIPVPRARAI
jgi:hypothetical protein